MQLYFRDSFDFERRDILICTEQLSSKFLSQYFNFFLSQFDISELFVVGLRRVSRRIIHWQSVARTFSFYVCFGVYELCCAKIVFIRGKKERITPTETVSNTILSPSCYYDISHIMPHFGVLTLLLNVLTFLLELS